MSEQNGMYIGKPKTNEVFFKKSTPKQNHLKKKTFLLIVHYFRNDLN